MSDIKLGAQLYTLRDYIQNYEDAEKTFAYLDSIGINTIQISAIDLSSRRRSHILLISTVWMSASRTLRSTACSAIPKPLSGSIK